MDTVTVAGLGLSVTALTVSVFNIWRQGRHEARVTSLSAMVPYTEKYERIMAQLDDHQRTRGLWGMDPIEARDAKTMRIFLQYCNLCSEEFHLAQSVLDPELWRIWRQEMQITFKSPFGRAGWAQAKKSGHFVSHGEFERQVDAWTSEVSPTPAAQQLETVGVEAA